MLAFLRLPACPSRCAGQLHAIMSEPEHFKHTVLGDTVEQEMPRVLHAVLGRKQPGRVPKVQRPNPGHTPYWL